MVTAQRETPMYDKVKFWLNRSAIDGASFHTIADRLSKAVEQTDRQTGEIKVYGSLDGLKVTVFCSGISIIGSLSKYLYPNTIYPLDRHTTKEAIENISDDLNIDFTKADVTGLEFGTVLLLSNSVHRYLARLGDMPYPMHRYQFGKDTLYYVTGSKQQPPPKAFAFYDKVAEAKKKNLTLPNGLEGKNILKYELRLNRRLPKQLNIPTVKAFTLYDRSFYRALLQQWQRNYFAISKKKQFKTNNMNEVLTAIRDKAQGENITVSDISNFIIGALMANPTNQELVTGIIDGLKDANIFADRKYYSRLKGRFKPTIETNGLVEDELIKELDNAVKNVGAYL